MRIGQRTIFDLGVPFLAGFARSGDFDVAPIFTWTSSAAPQRVVEERPFKGRVEDLLKDWL
jgi:hypothetical protein